MRLAVARDEGLDESDIEKISRYESSDLAPAHKAALRLADALMTQPGEIDQALRAELHRHFTTEQLRELTLDVMKWNHQKVVVALAIDDEIAPGELTDLVFDADGNWVR